MSKVPPRLPEDLTKLTVKDLKAELTDFGLSTKGRKAELISRLQEHVDSLGGDDGGDGDDGDDGDDGQPAEEGKDEPGNKSQSSDGPLAKTGDTDDAAVTGKGNEKEANKEPAKSKSNEAEKRGEEAKPAKPKPESTPKTESPAAGDVTKPAQPDKAADKDSAKSSKSKASEPAAPTSEPSTAKKETVESRRPSRRSRDVEFKSKRLRADELEEEAAAATVDDDQDTPSQSADAAKDDNATRFLHVQGFRRPLKLSQVKELLSETGTLVDSEEAFSMNKIKSECCAEFETVEQAKATLTALDGLQWPKPHGVELQASFVSGNVLLNPELAGPQQKRMKRDPVRMAAKPPPAEPDQQAASLLDDLFRTTKTLPKLYWLPLSEEEVAAKRALAKQREKEREQQADTRRRSRSPSRSRRRSRSRSRTPPRNRNRSPLARRRSRTPPRYRR